MALAARDGEMGGERERGADKESGGEVSPGI